MRFYLWLRMLGFRNIWPAKVGNVGWHKIFSLVVTQLPFAGMWCLLFILSITGLYIEESRQKINRRLEELSDSPYMALYSEAFLSLPVDKRNCDPNNELHLCFWNELKIQDVIKNDPGKLSSAQVFDGVYPFSNASLIVRNADDEHLEYQKGIVLHFSGDNKDEKLIRGIEKNLGGPLPDNIANEGIILSEKALDIFGFNIDNLPDLLWVKKEYNKKEIPIRIWGIAKKLPYKRLYIMSKKQWDLLDKKNYYYEKTKKFKILLPLEYPPKKAEEVRNEIIKSLSSDDIVELVSEFGSNLAIDIKLYKNTPRLDNIKKLLLPDFKNRRIKWVDKHNDQSYSREYHGAIFHLNFKLFEDNEDEIQNTNLLFEIDNFMDRKQMKVKGELIYALQEVINNRNSMKNLEKSFFWILLSMGLIIFIFFSVVLHTRMHRIGVKRMIGVSGGLLWKIYFFEGLFLVVTSFFSAVLMIRLIPLAIEMSLFSKELWFLFFKIFAMKEFWVLFFKIFAVTEVGLFLPFYIFFLLLKPAEMVAYRS